MSKASGGSVPQLAIPLEIRQNREVPGDKVFKVALAPEKYLQLKENRFDHLSASHGGLLKL